MHASYSVLFPVSGATAHRAFATSDSSFPQREQNEKISKENNILIRKILELDSKQRLDRYRTFHRLPSEYAAVPRTLNGAARRKSLNAITKQNHAILRRIIQAQPTFDRDKLVEAERERRVLLSRLAVRPRL